jgi:hypothetical protein
MLVNADTPVIAQRSLQIVMFTSFRPENYCSVLSVAGRFWVASMAWARAGRV